MALSNHAPSVMKFVAAVLLLGGAYLLTGKAGLALAIPPGYATAIFPAAGVALAALLLWGLRLWPGVFLGSFALNIWVTLAAGQAATPIAFALSAAIGSGAALQALFGAWLIRRFLGFPNTLSRGGEVIRFLLLGGAVGCLMSATVGISSLWLAGVVSADNLLFSWWTWWVGDTLGVLLGTPIILTFFSEPKSLWRARRWPVALPMALVTMVIVPSFIAASHWESQRITLEFRKRAALLQQTLESNIRLKLDAIHALRDFSYGVEKMDFKGFSTFTAGMLSRHPSLHAISYNARVRSHERTAFEAAIQREVDPDFTINERSPEGILGPAADRSEYVTVTYIQPLDANRKALGFDVASNPVRKTALDLARDTNQLVATGRVNLVQDRYSQAGVLVFLPVFPINAKQASAEERGALLQGYFVGVFRVGELLASALKGVDPQEISAGLYDARPTQGSSPFLAGYGGGQERWNEDIALESGLGHAGPWWSESFDFGGRQWRLELSPTRTLLETQRSWGPWFVLAGGLLFASLLGAFLLLLTGRTARVEDLVLKRTGQLADRESRLAAILETAGDGIITINVHGIIESANPAAAQLFGYAPGEMIGRDVNTIMLSSKQEHNGVIFKPAQHNGKAHADNLCQEVEGLRKDGSTIPLELSVTEMKLVDQTLFTGILHDLTERKRADKLKNEFVSTVSHELRTPLTSIYGGLKLLVSGGVGTLPEQARNLVELAYRNSERLNLLINDILDIQKIESGRFAIELKPLDAATLVRQALEENKSYAEKFGIRYNFVEPIPEALTINGDQARLNQVLVNLLSNAAKFTTCGDVVEIRVERKDLWVQFSVTDHGPGIPEVFQSRIFQKFAQADSSSTRQSGGTGLGLSISKALVESHHGKIGFRTKVDEGTTFFFRLPIMPSEAI